MTSAGRAAVVALLDDAMAEAARARLDSPRELVAIDLHIAFLQAASGALVAQARATGGGRSVCFCEASLVDASGAVAAQAMGTFRLRDAA